ncbi:MAG: hypothetical protein HND52_19275 [Ignavibacteriae bacterium]|jgi:fructokinase|nr:hypothetical protein [Ignavibacteriota bacterium]NOH00109.1 hypothetical protein [Ignavibacteriota bacterium]
MNKKIITSIGEILFDVYEGEKQIGGAPFNFIYHINKIAGNTNFITAIGDDEEGKEILQFLKSSKISTKYVDIKSDIETGKVLIELNENKIPDFTIFDNRAYDYINLSKVEEDEIIAESKLLYFGSLSQRNKVSRTTIQNLANGSYQSMFDINIRQNFYSKDIIERSLTACNILKVNEDELKLISELFFDENEGYYKTVKKIKEKYKIEFVSVTKGEEGAELFSNSGTSFCKSPAVNVVDTVGAGDAYSAILALGILHNIDIEKINFLAVSFASEVIKRKGALIEDEEIYKIYGDKILDEQH